MTTLTDRIAIICVKNKGGIGTSASLTMLANHPRKSWPERIAVPAAHAENRTDTVSSDPARNFQDPA